MYSPGRRRTGSSPCRTVMCSAVYVESVAMSGFMVRGGVGSRRPSQVPSPRSGEGQGEADDPSRSPHPTGDPEKRDDPLPVPLPRTGEGTEEGACLDELSLSPAHA